MRQRKLRNLETKYEAYEDIIIADPAAMRGRWSERSGGAPLYIEIGCGKGKFISELAAREPDHYFIAIEGNKSVMMRAMEKIRDLELSNVVFIPEFAGDLSDWFGDGEAEGIYLNFSDPLPKNYWYKRRLTYRDRLKSYFRVLKPEGTVTFKTDNTDLFNWSLTEIAAADLRILDMTRDLHSDPERNADNIETEYEAKYSGFGEDIKRVIIGQSERETDVMASKSMAAYNGREIPKEDKNFTASGKANAAIAEKGNEAVFNATVGALYDDDGDLVVLKSVEETLHGLSGSDFAAYAPIAGTPGFKQAAIKAAFGSYEPKSFIKAVATPGGTASIRNAVANYSEPGDKILTHNWFWGPYKNIASELGRSLETFEMFDEEGHFNITDFAYKLSKLLRNQNHLVIILNTPASNPTGYSLSMEDWQGVKKSLDETDLSKKITLVVDAAYIDYAGEEDEVRGFLRILDTLRSNVLPVIAYSASKTFTMYGFRCGAMICMAHSPEVAAEFEKLCAFSARSTWSNSPRAPQTVIERIYNDPELLDETNAERKFWRDKLLARGKAFEEEAGMAGLPIVPFRAGFFITIPCSDPDVLCNKLNEKDVYLIPVSGGTRVSVAALNEDKCRKLPAIIKEAMEIMQ